jgi:hypothetical protein
MGKGSFWKPQLTQLLASSITSSYTGHNSLNRSES